MTIAVTGGTGFLGGWGVAELLRRGHDVRTTVRDVAREPAVRATAERAGVDAGDRLTVVAADLGGDAGWADAVAGCGGVLHVASPFPPEQPRKYVWPPPVPRVQRTRRHGCGRQTRRRGR